MRKVKFKKHRACLNMKCGNKTIFEIQYRSYLLDTKAEKQVLILPGSMKKKTFQGIEYCSF